MGTSAIALKAFIPTMIGFGAHGLAHISAASIVGMFAPIAVIIIISYAALALKDVTELLSRENLKESFKQNIKTALGRDAAEEFPNSIAKQNHYKYRQWAILGITVMFVALAIFGTFTTATIGLEGVTAALPQLFMMMHLTQTPIALGVLNPYLIAMAVSCMTPFLWKTLYQFSNAMFRGYDALVKLYTQEKDRPGATPASATLTCIKFLGVKALWSTAFYVGLAGTVNAFCQGFIASLHYPNLHELPMEQQVDASFRLIGQSSKYQGLAVKTAENWHLPSIQPTKMICIEEGIVGSIDAVDTSKKYCTKTYHPFFISYDKQGNKVKTYAGHELETAGFNITNDGHIKLKAKMA
jgi:hypothetical protein